MVLAMSVKRTDELTAELMCFAVINILLCVCRDHPSKSQPWINEIWKDTRSNERRCLLGTFGSIGRHHGVESTGSELVSVSSQIRSSKGDIGDIGDVDILGDIGRCRIAL